MNPEVLNKLVNDITNLGYKVSDLLNQGIDAGTLTEEQLLGLRLAAAYLGNANSEVFALLRAERERQQS